MKGDPARRPRGRLRHPKVIELELELGHGARVLFTDRHGGVSTGPYASLNLGLWTDDDPQAVRTNRGIVADRVGRELQQGRQVHGARVVVDATEVVDADGQVAIERDSAPIVLVADCLPIALAGPRGVAMLHGGWRGLAGGIVEEGVRALGGEVEAAAIGPGAGPCCYEAGEEVHAAFAHLGPGVRNAGNADLKAVARLQLEAAGVLDVQDVGLCTMCDERFFSHRRDGGTTGRQAGVVWR
jgi:YfiH family protein